MPASIGLLGGSFDPVHHGHLILARDAVEALGLDELRFIPAARNPLKATGGAPGELRLAMLRAATADELGFAVDDVELHRPPPSYTVDTVAAIARRFPDARLTLLVGEDNVPGFPRWHRWEELRAAVGIVVLRRGSGEEPMPFRTLTARRLDISATEIRNRVAAGRSIRYLVPEAVREIIAAHGLYREPSPPAPFPLSKPNS